MKISQELETIIVRCFCDEKLLAGSIAHKLHVHHGTVSRVIAQSGLSKTSRPTSRPSIVDDYLPLLRQTLQKFPNLAASKIFNILHEAGYSGGSDHLRHLVACIREPSDPVDWMLSVLQKKIGEEQVKNDIDDTPDLSILLRQVYIGTLLNRNKAMTILASHRRLTDVSICDVLGISPYACRKYIRLYSSGGTKTLFLPKPRAKKSDDELLKAAIFKVLHEPPSIATHK